jgi:hypothetical protein
MKTLRTKLVNFLGGIFAFTVIGIIASPSFSQDIQIMTLRTQYSTAVTERGDAVQIALGTAESILSKNPQDAVAKAYKGSLLTIVGAESLMPWNKLKYVNIGLELMDDAVDQNGSTPSYGLPADMEILMVSGFTNARMPEMFKREPLARQNISRLIAHLEFGMLEPDLRAQALAIAAAYAHADGNEEAANTLLDQAIAADADTARSVYDERS